MGSVLEAELFAVGAIDHDGFGAIDLAGQEALGELVEEVTLDGTLHGTGAELGVEALAGQEPAGVFRHAQFHIVGPKNRRNRHFDTMKM